MNKASNEKSSNFNHYPFGSYNDQIFMSAQNGIIAYEMDV